MGWILLDSCGVHDWLYYAYRRCLKYPFFLVQGLVILGKCLQILSPFKLTKAAFIGPYSSPNIDPNGDPANPSHTVTVLFPLILERSFSLRPNRHESNSSIHQPGNHDKPMPISCPRNVLDSYWFYPPHVWTNRGHKWRGFHHVWTNPDGWKQQSLFGKNRGRSGIPFITSLNS